MATNKWDEDDEDSTPPSSPPPVARRGKFDDEEVDSDAPEAWDEEDSEVERQKAKKAAEATAKAEAEKKAKHKSAAARRKEHIEKRRLQSQDDTDSDDDDETEAEKRERLRLEEKEGDLKHAVDLFGEIGISKRTEKKAVALINPNDPTSTIELSALPLFNPTTKDQFLKLRETLIPLLNANSKKAHYVLFLQELTKQISKDLPSDQIKKIASGLTTLSNEKMKEEKIADKGGKKSKAAKSKVTLNASRDVSHKADTSVYDDDGLDDGDFM